MSGQTIDPVIKVIEVETSAARAFLVFTREIGAWWPLDTHSLADHAKGERGVDVTIEAQSGGRVFETLNSGETREWGEVVTFDPPRAFSMWWRLGRPPEQGTLVTVRFDAAGPNLTRVTLTHELWERLGDAARATRDNYDQGWVKVFAERYKRACAA